jgi:hypothetical protein
MLLLRFEAQRGGQTCWLKLLPLLAISAALLLSLRASAQTLDGTARLSRTNLLLYHGRGGEVRAVTSRVAWLERRQEILRGMEQIIGPLPGKEKRRPLDMQITEEKDCGSYVRRLISYASEPGSRVPAYLLTPKSALNSGKKLPAILALHPTDMEYGHRVVVEPMREHYRAYAHDLAERGFVILAPAYPLMARYQPDFNKLGYQSGTMKAVWDNIRGLDLLESLPFVKRGRVGAIGHSLGGHNAIFTAVFEPRLQALVVSCGFDSFSDYYDGDTTNWEAGRGWCQERYMPRLSEYRGRTADIPFDFSELLGALAPRPVFVNAPLHDSNFEWKSVDRMVAAASEVYRLYSAPQNLRVEHPDCAHDFPTQMREEAYRFLEERLR